MAVAGGAGPGRWMHLDGTGLVVGKAVTTTAQVRDYDEAVAAILAGQRVHVDTFRSLDQRVAERVREMIAVEEKLAQWDGRSTYIPGVSRKGGE